MELLSETEARGFGSFLDNFAEASEQELVRNPFIVGGGRPSSEPIRDATLGYTGLNGNSHHQMHGTSPYPIYPPTDGRWPPLQNQQQYQQQHQQQHHQQQQQQQHQQQQQQQQQHQHRPPHAQYQTWSDPIASTSAYPTAHQSSYPSLNPNPPYSYPSSGGGYHYSPLAVPSSSATPYPSSSSSSSLVPLHKSYMNGPINPDGSDIVSRSGEQYNNSGFSPHQLRFPGVTSASILQSQMPASQSNPRNKLEEAEQVRLEKMAQQARDLSQWMKSRGIGAATGGSGGGDGADESNKNGSTINQENQNDATHTESGRGSTTNADSSLRDNTTTDNNNTSREKKRRSLKTVEEKKEDEAILRMKQAESKATALSRRVIAVRRISGVKEAEGHGKKASGIGASGSSETPSVNGIHSPSSLSGMYVNAPSSKGVSKKRRAISPKATTGACDAAVSMKMERNEDKFIAQSTESYKERRDTVFSEMNPNPPPETTPSNIPPCPYPPVPPRPSVHRASTATNSGTTSNPNTDSQNQNGFPALPGVSKVELDSANTEEVGVDSAGGSAGQKPALLTVAQKKANHIASEQKRRAAIRAGYEGLCSIVPALRAAVEEFEERAKKVKSTNSNGKKSTGGGLMGGIQIGGEKVDGRAGPKSEAVVLGKSVDRVRVLLRKRQALMARLSSVYEAGFHHGVDIPGGYRNWEDRWDDSYASELNNLGARRGENAGEDDEDDWEEEDDLEG